MNTYRKLANAVSVFHWIWVAILLGGISLQFAFQWYKPIHMIVLTTTIVSQVLWLGCPLVALENALRAKYDPKEMYYGSFICHYLKKRFGISMSPALITAQLVAMVVVSGILWIK